MSRRSLLLSIVLSFVVLSPSASKCWGDVPGQQNLPTKNIQSLIEAGKYAEAQAAIGDMTSTFSGDANLPRALYEIAWRYELSEKFPQAEATYQQIAQSYPQNSLAGKALLDVSKIGVLSFIKSGQDSAAQTAINNLTTNFSSNPDLPEALYVIADGYERSSISGRYDKAKDLFQQVALQYPGSSVAGKAILDVQKIIVLSLLESGKDSQAQESLNKMSSDFSGSPYMAEALYRIGRKCEWSGKYKLARDTYQQIVQQYPNSSDVDEVRMSVPRMNILFLIESGEDGAAQAATQKMVSDFSDNPYLPEALYGIAEGHERAKKYQQAKAVYQQIVQQYPDSSRANKARLDIPKRDILSLIESGQDSAAEAAVDQMTAAFSGNSYLPEVLYRIATRYDELKKYENAQNLYQYIANQYPGSSYAGRARLYSVKINILSMVDSGQDVAIQSALQSLMTNFSGNSYLPLAMFRIGEQYYNKAGQLDNEGLTSQSIDCFQKALAIWDTVTATYPDSVVTPDIYCLKGDCYHKLGDYNKSIEYYKKVADDYPDYWMAWHALFMVGHNYEALKDSGAMLQPEADLRTRAAYERLVEKYSSCPSAMIANRWLSRHSSN